MHRLSVVKDEQMGNTASPGVLQDRNKIKQGPVCTHLYAGSGDEIVKVLLTDVVEGL